MCHDPVSCAAEHESTRKELERSQQQLESKIEQVFTGSKHDLQIMIEQHSSELQLKKEELAGVSRTMYGGKCVCVCVCMCCVCAYVWCVSECVGVCVCVVFQFFFFFSVGKEAF